MRGGQQNRNGLETITPTNPPTAQIGQRVALSQGDLASTQSHPVLTHGQGESVVVRPRVVGS
jgi:hypothetical protein